LDEELELLKFLLFPWSDPIPGTKGNYTALAVSLNDVTTLTLENLITIIYEVEHEEDVKPNTTSQFGSFANKSSVGGFIPSKNPKGDGWCDVKCVQTNCNYTTPCCPPKITVLIPKHGNLVGPMTDQFFIHTPIGLSKNGTTMSHWVLGYPTSWLPSLKCFRPCKRWANGDVPAIGSNNPCSTNVCTKSMEMRPKLDDSVLNMTNLCGSVGTPIFDSHPDMGMDMDGLKFKSQGATAPTK